MALKKTFHLRGGKQSLSALILTQGVLALGLGLFLTSFVFAAGGTTGGTVEGTIKVKKTYVDCTGPKSDKDVVVYLVPVSGAKADPPTAHAQMDQKGLNFIPHVLAVQKGTTVDFENQDSVNHNVSSPSACCVFDLGQWGKGVAKNHVFDAEGDSVILCSLHPEMAAHVVVLNTPYFKTVEIVTNNAEKKQSAKYSIKGVPAGKYTLKVWHKKLVAGAQEITVTDGAATT
ncbi:MAG TPA: hypothetical protein VJ873_13550, partial [bacterium]|nr:hypothetical protein [bacterium]